MTPAALAVTDPFYTITIQPARRMAVIAMFGFWTDGVSSRFERQLREGLAAMVRSGCPIGLQRTLFDLTGFAVQQQQTLTNLGSMINDPTIGSQRIAILSTSALLRQQARRTAPDYGVFDDRDMAMAWLEEPR